MIHGIKLSLKHLAVLLSHASSDLSLDKAGLMGQGEPVVFLRFKLRTVTGVRINWMSVSSTY